MAPRKTARASEFKRCDMFFNIGANGAAIAGVKNTIAREPDVFNQKSCSEERFLSNLLGYGFHSLAKRSDQGRPSRSYTTTERPDCCVVLKSVGRLPPLIG